jgi:glutamate racemase
MTFPDPTARPIGILDSGVGGLSILREIRAQWPAEHLLFVADQAHVPYGPRDIDEVRSFSESIVRWLVAQQVKLVVVACNAASAAALYPLRERFPALPFVGMEPAVKPAARDTRTGVIGVIATKATFQGELYASVVGRFAQGVRVETRECPEFVTLAEAGETHSDAARAAVRRCLDPLIQAGIDQLVLGCTHFPFLGDVIRETIGPGIALVDPSAAVARQVGRLLAREHLQRHADTPGRVTYRTTGDPDRFRRTLAALFDADLAAAADVRALSWVDVLSAAGQDPLA